MCKICDSLKNVKENPYFIMELETGYVMLGWFQRFKGYTVFECKQHGPELHNLERNFRIKHLEEMAIVAEAVCNVFKPDKLNYELLGNGCPHIHWHLYPRTKGDTPAVSSVYQLPNSVLFDESTRPSEKIREEYKAKIKKEIERLLSK
jgi:Diadenosine tetraphosphate (Ap4A) hydrolase and other HIT family hydrolases